MVRKGLLVSLAICGMAIGGVATGDTVSALSECKNNYGTDATCRTIQQWFAGTGAPTYGNTAYVNAITTAIKADPAASYNAKDLAEMSLGKELKLNGLIPTGWPINIEKLTGLTSLTIEGCTVDGKKDAAACGDGTNPFVYIQDISFINVLTNLVNLDVSNNVIRDLSKGADGAIDWSKLSKLTTLNLGNNQIVDLTPLSKATSLEHLVLEGNVAYYDETLKANVALNDLSPIVNLPNLKTLNLKLTDTQEQLGAIGSLLNRCVTVVLPDPNSPIPDLPAACTPAPIDPPATGVDTAKSNGSLIWLAIAGAATAIAAVLAGVGYRIKSRR